MKLGSRVIRPRFLIPLAVFLVVCVFFAVGLRLDSSLVPSPLVGRAAPQFNLPLLHLEQASFSPKHMNGEVWLLNVWASWCAACRDEHDDLVALAEQGIPIVGLNYKDVPASARRWLRDWGNPYRLTAVDQEGDAAIDWGVYGVPETFVIDRDGVIRFKHIGPITYAAIDSEISKLRAESTQ